MTNYSQAIATLVWMQNIHETNDPNNQTYIILDARELLDIK